MLIGRFLREVESRNRGIGKCLLVEKRNRSLWKGKNKYKGGS